MNTSIYDETMESLFEFGREMANTSGVRAVAAWVALCDPEVVYDLDDCEAPYELRDVIGTDIGWDAADEGLIGGKDIPRYWDYLTLHVHFGDEWPMPALTEYFERFRQMSRQDAENAAMDAWRLAMERYEEPPIKAA